MNECQTGALRDCTNPYDDSCTVKKACGGNSTCQNLIGSYECTCKSGYKYANGDETDPYHEDRGCIGEFWTLYFSISYTFSVIAINIIMAETLLIRFNMCCHQKLRLSV